MSALHPAGAAQHTPLPPRRVLAVVHPLVDRAKPVANPLAPGDTPPPEPLLPLDAWDRLAGNAEWGSSVPDLMDDDLDFGNEAPTPPLLPPPSPSPPDYVRLLVVVRALLVTVDAVEFPCAPIACCALVPGTAPHHPAVDDSLLLVLTCGSLLLVRFFHTHTVEPRVVQCLRADPATGAAALTHTVAVHTLGLYAAVAASHHRLRLLHLIRSELGGLAIHLFHDVYAPGPLHHAVFMPPYADNPGLVMLAVVATRGRPVVLCFRWNMLAPWRAITEYSPYTLAAVPALVAPLDASAVVMCSGASLQVLTVHQILNGENDVCAAVVDDPITAVHTGPTVFPLADLLPASAYAPYLAASVSQCVVVAGTTLLAVSVVDHTQVVATPLMTLPRDTSVLQLHRNDPDVMISHATPTGTGQAVVVDRHLVSSHIRVGKVLLPRQLEAVVVADLAGWGPVLDCQVLASHGVWCLNSDPSVVHVRNGYRATKRHASGNPTSRFFCGEVDERVYVVDSGVFATAATGVAVDSLLHTWWMAPCAAGVLQISETAIGIATPQAYTHCYGNQDWVVVLGHSVGEQAVVVRETAAGCVVEGYRIGSGLVFSFQAAAEPASVRLVGPYVFVGTFSNTVEVYSAAGTRLSAFSTPLPMSDALANGLDWLVGTQTGHLVHGTALEPGPTVHAGSHPVQLATSPELFPGVVVSCGRLYVGTIGDSGLTPIVVDEHTTPTVYSCAVLPLPVGLSMLCVRSSGVVELDIDLNHQPCVRREQLPARCSRLIVHHKMRQLVVVGLCSPHDGEQRLVCVDPDTHRVVAHSEEGKRRPLVFAPSEWASCVCEWAYGGHCNLVVGGSHGSGGCVKILRVLVRLRNATVRELQLWRAPDPVVAVCVVDLAIIYGCGSRVYVSQYHSATRTMAAVVELASCPGTVTLAVAVGDRVVVGTTSGCSVYRVDFANMRTVASLVVCLGPVDSVVATGTGFAVVSRGVVRGYRIGATAFEVVFRSAVEPGSVVTSGQLLPPWESSAPLDRTVVVDESGGMSTFTPLRVPREPEPCLQPESVGVFPLASFPPPASAGVVAHSSTDPPVWV